MKKIQQFAKGALHRARRFIDDTKRRQARQRREMVSRITLADLREAAQSMDMEVVCGFIPKKGGFRRGKRRRRAARLAAERTFRSYRIPD